MAGCKNCTFKAFDLPVSYYVLFLYSFNLLLNLNHNNYADCLLCLKSITKLKFVLIMTGQQAARLTGSKADRQQASHTADPKVEIIFEPADI